jgi:alpha-glucosidase
VRIDVVHCLGKDPALPDNAPEIASVPMSALNDHPSTHGIIRGLRTLVDEYDGERVTVGEVYLLSTAAVARYYGHGDELHLAFNFPPLYTPWNASAWRQQIGDVVAHLDPRDAWPTWVLSNHDNARHRTRYGSEARARAAAVLLLTLRGTPFLYAGEELGLEDALIPPERVRDPGGRDGCRAPIPWTAAPDHGWATADAWLPWTADAATRNVESLRADTGSILHLYRRLLVARRRSPALRTGTWSALPAPEGVLAYQRTRAGDDRIVLVNFTRARVSIDVPKPCVVEVASAGAREGAAYDGTLGPDEALVLRFGIRTP